MPDIIFGEWLPDLNPVDMPGLLEAENVYPTTTGFTSFPGSAAAQGLDALTGVTIRGAFAGRTQKGESFLVVGANDDTGGSIEVNFAWGNGSNWEKNAVPSGSEMTSKDAEAKYSFGVYGNHVLMAATGANTCFVDTTDNNPSATNPFIAATNASRAAVVAVHKEFVILGDIDGAGTSAQVAAIGRQRAGVHWSAIGDPENWPDIGTQAAINVQSDIQILDGEGGRITDIVSVGEWCAVFRENQIWRMDYVGGNQFFQFRLLDSSRGCNVNGAAIAVGGMVYFPSEEGFLSCDGAQVQAVGEGKVDTFWRDSVDWNNTRAIHATYNAETESIYWLMPEGSGFPKKILCYRPSIQRWFLLSRPLGQQVLFDGYASVSSIGGKLDGDDSSFADMNMDIGGHANTASIPSWVTGVTTPVGTIIRTASSGIFRALGSLEKLYLNYADLADPSTGTLVDTLSALKSHFRPGDDDGIALQGDDGTDIVETGALNPNTGFHVADPVTGVVSPTGSVPGALQTNGTVIFEYVVDGNDQGWETSPLMLGDLDAMGVSFGTKGLACVNEFGVVEIYNQPESPLIMKILTGDFEIAQGQRGVLRWIRPIYVGDGTFSAQVGASLNTNQLPTMKFLKWMDDTGVLTATNIASQAGPGRPGGRYMRAEFQSTSKAEKFVGFDFDVRGGQGSKQNQR